MPELNAYIQANLFLFVQLFHVLERHVEPTKDINLLLVLPSDLLVSFLFLGNLTRYKTSQRNIPEANGKLDATNLRLDDICGRRDCLVVGETNSIECRIVFIYKK